MSKTHALPLIETFPNSFLIKTLPAGVATTSVGSLIDGSIRRTGSENGLFGWMNIVLGALTFSASEGGHARIKEKQQQRKESQFNYSFIS